MSLAANIIFLFVLSAGLSWALTISVRQAAVKLGILDWPSPDPRKIHKQPMPLSGGWAIYLAMLIVTAVLFSQGQVPDDKVSPLLLIGFFISGLLLMIGGSLDDKYKLKWWQSLFFPLAASLLIIACGLKVGYITNPLGGLLYLKDWPLLIAGGLVFGWLMLMTYTTKLLDGLDGLASSIGLIAGLVIFVVSLFWDDRGSTTTYLSIILAGSILGFLIWNWHPAKIFLGEGGSTFLGFALGVLAILTGGKIATALLVMGLPMLDVIWVISRRLFSRRRVTFADTGHLHFRLLRLGLSQRQVVIFMSVIALLFGSLSFFTTRQGKVTALIVLVILMLILGRLVIYRQKKNEA